MASCAAYGLLASIFGSDSRPTDSFRVSGSVPVILHVCLRLRCFRNSYPIVGGLSMRSAVRIGFITVPCYISFCVASPRTRRRLRLANDKVGNSLSLPASLFKPLFVSEAWRALSMGGSDCLDTVSLRRGSALPAVIEWSSLLFTLLVLLLMISTGIWSVCSTVFYLALNF